MSRTLARLRRLLDDQLLIRGADGYQLTPGGEELRAQLDEVVPRLHKMFLNREYRPAAATREFRMTGTDYALATFGADVSSAVLSAAPRASLRFYPWHAKIAQELADGRIDLMFSGLRLAHPITSRLLFTDEMVGVVHRDHPLAEKRGLSMGQYLKCDHLVVDVMDGTQPSIDAVLSSHGTQRRVALTVPYHACAAAALVGTELLLSFPSRALTAFVTGHSQEFRVLRLPVGIRPLPYYVSWHTRQNENKGHVWLRECAVGAVVGQQAS